MRIARLAILAAAVSAALPTLAISFRHEDPVRRAVILHEVQQHLDQARDCSASGAPEVGVAHANLVLVDDEITYAVMFVGVPDRLHGHCSKALDGAFNAWKRALDDTISFRDVQDPDKADIVLRFKPAVFMGKEPVAGYANWKRTLKSDGGHVQATGFKSDLQIRTANLDGCTMPCDCIRHEIAHEVGHILGLEDSDTVGDLMGPLDIDHPVGGPLSFEALAVRNLRDDAHRVRTDALAKVGK